MRYLTSLSFAVALLVPLRPAFGQEPTQLAEQVREAETGLCRHHGKTRSCCVRRLCRRGGRLLQSTWATPRQSGCARGLATVL